MPDASSESRRSRLDEARARLQTLAQFRYTLRKFLRFSEEAARSCGITPQQHQLMLGIAGFSDTGSTTISQLAEFLQEKNHSVIGLVERAAQSGLVVRQQSPADRRVVLVSLTPHGEEILLKLSEIHENQVQTVVAASSVTPECS